MKKIIIIFILLETTSEEPPTTLITTTETIKPSTSKTETLNVLTGVQPSGGERLIDLLKKIGANTKSKFNGEYIILLAFKWGSLFLKF